MNSDWLEVPARCLSLPTLPTQTKEEFHKCRSTESLTPLEHLTPDELQERGLQSVVDERYDYAIMCFEAGLTKSRAAPKATLLSAKSRAHLLVGNITSAMEDAYRCTQEHPDFVDSYLHLGEACMSIGDRERARTCAVQAKSLQSANVKVNQLLSRSSETKQSNPIAMLFLQQVVGASALERASVLRNWDNKIKEEMQETILEDWNAIIFFIISPNAAAIMSHTRFTLLKEILNMESNSSCEIVSDVCHACFSFGDALNRTLMLQIAVAGWCQIIPQPRSIPLISVAGFCLCLGFAFLQIKSGSRASNIEKAISSFEKAVGALNPENFPEPWAAAHQGLGQAYKIRLRGLKDENSLQAVQHFKGLISINTTEMNPLRHALVQHEIAQLYASTGRTKQCLEHVDLCILSLDASRSAGERQLKATVHRFAADMLVQAARKLLQEETTDILANDISEYLSGAIQHFQAVLQLYSVHEYPITTLTIKTEVAKLKVWRSNLSSFEKGGLVCFVTSGDRQSLMTAHQEFVEALAGAEACAMVFHGYDGSLEPVSAVWLEIQKRLFSCFSGCIETAIRLGNYAQALAYSERSRVHDVLEVALATSSRPWLLQAMPPETVATFLKLRSRLDHYARCLRTSSRIGREGEMTFTADSRLRGMLRDAAKLILLFSNIGAHTGGKKMRLIQLNMPPIMDIGPSIWQKATSRDRDEVIVEWYMGNDRAYAFIISDKDPSPRTIEYTCDQTKAIIEATYAFCAVASSMGPHDIGETDPMLSSLIAISDALRVDAILAAVPSHSKRLIVVPHGVLYSVPFSALPCSIIKASKPRSVQTVQYLLDRFTLGIVCVPSIAMLQWCEDRASQMRFAPILQGLALHKYSTKKHAEGKENARSDAEFACLRKSLSKLTVEHQLTLDRLLNEREDSRKTLNHVTMASADLVHCSCKSLCRVDQGFKAAIDEGEQDEVDTAQPTHRFGATHVANDGGGYVTGLVQEISRQDPVPASPHSSREGHGARGGLPVNLGYKGLPLGFMIAGSSSTLECLWHVDHDCRVIFWSRFYETLITEGKDVAETLRLTQMWLREVSELELLKSYPKEMNNSSVQQQIEELEAKQAEAGDKEAEAGRGPFMSPYLWGGLVLWGDGMVSGHRKTDKKEAYDYNAAVSKYAENQEQKQA